MILIKRIRFFIYAIVGAISAGINFSLYSILFYLGMHYKIAATIAHITSAVFHFMANRHFTFQSTAESVTKQASKYLVITGTNYVMTITMISLLIEKLAMNPYLAMIFVIAMNTTINYLISKFWVFKIQPIRG